MIVCNLDKLLKRRGIRPREFSERCGVHYLTVLHVARGRSQRIDLDTLDKICKTLDVQPGVIFRWTPGAQPRTTKPSPSRKSQADAHPADCPCYDCQGFDRTIDRLERETHRAVWPEDFDP